MKVLNHLKNHNHHYFRELPMLIPHTTELDALIDSEGNSEESKLEVIKYIFLIIGFKDSVG